MLKSIFRLQEPELSRSLIVCFVIGVVGALTISTTVIVHDAAVKVADDVRSCAPAKKIEKMLPSIRLDREASFPVALNP